MTTARCFGSAFALALISVLPACGEATAPDPISRHAQPILDGVLDTDTDAVLLSGHMIGIGEMCSSLLITPDLLLTAWHCMTTDAQIGPIVCEGADATVRSQVIAPADTLVLTGDSLDDPSSAYLAVDELIGLPGAGTTPTCGNDLVALRLQKASKIEPLALRLEPAVEVGDTLSIVGFGVNPPSDPNSSGIRRRREGVKIIAVDHFEDPGGNATATTGELVIDEGACPGDSGSPAFDDMGQVVAVMSRGNTTTCAEMVYEQVNPHAAWIREIVAASSTRLGIDVPEWAEPLPVEDAGSDAAPAVDAGEAGADAAGGDAAAPPGPAAAAGETSGSCAVRPGRASTGVGLLALLGVVASWVRRGVFARRQAR